MLERIKRNKSEKCQKAFSPLDGLAVKEQQVGISPSHVQAIFTGSVPGAAHAVQVRQAHKAQGRQAHVAHGQQCLPLRRQQ